jgi:hypothetical protein
MFRRTCGLLLACAAWLSWAPSVSGQVLNSPLAGQTQLTPQQALGIAQMRALSRGRGQVRTGYPQYIPMGPENMTATPVGGPSNGQQVSGAGKTSAQKRMEARQARDEQKKAAREDAKAKGAKGKNANAKNLKAKNAKVAKKVASKPTTEK